MKPKTVHATTPFFCLDNTLRLLYDTLRLHGGQLLAIKFHYRGIEYTADTPEEADRLRQRLEDTDYERAETDSRFKERVSRQLSGWTDEKFWHVVKTIGEQQARLLYLLYVQDVLESKDIAAALNLPSQEALAGVVSGLSKQLEKAKVRPNEVFTVETFWVGKKKERHFRLTPGFAGAAKETHWGKFWRYDEWCEKAHARLFKKSSHGGKKKKT